MSPLLIAYSLWAGFALVWNIAGRWTATPAVETLAARRERRYELVLAGGLILIVLAPVNAAARRLWTSPPGLDWLMLVVVTAGLACCWWARLHLGRLWSAEVTRKTGHRIVETGPYRLVRHPIYTGFIVCYMGLAMLSATTFGFAGLVLASMGLWLKAREEERFLAQAVDSHEYAEYRKRTPMLMPRLSRSGTRT